MFMLVNDASAVFVNAMPTPVVCWMVPPELSPPTLVFPSPVTVNPPLVPVLFKMMPLTGSVAPVVLVPEEMLWKVRPLAPIVVFATLSAVALTEAIELPVPVTLIVPPPVALKPMLLVVEIARLPPVKSMVPPVLPVRLIPLAVVVSAVIAPPKVVVPPVLALMETALAAFVCRIVPLYVTFAVLVFSLNAVPVGLVVAPMEAPLPNAIVPLEPVLISTCALPPFSVVVPLKLTVPSALLRLMPVPALELEESVPVWKVIVPPLSLVTSTISPALVPLLVILPLYVTFALLPLA